jgi:hypothetical protein
MHIVNTNLELFYCSEIEPHNLFVTFFKEVPNIYRFKEFYAHEQLLKFLINQYSSNEIFKVYQKHTKVYDKCEELNSYVVVVQNGCIINYSEWNNSLIVLHNDNQSLLAVFKRFVKKHPPKDYAKPKFYMTVFENGDLSLRACDAKQTDIKIKTFFNDDFEPIHQRIFDFVNKSDMCGLIILHGKHGTGKTTYLRHIIASSKLKVIYLSSELVSNVSNPDFLRFMIKNKNSLIIIEDCEELLKSRNNSMTVNSGLINILNMSDGLLGDALSYKLICTFNAPLEDIDKALLRKGRLIARYEFRDLEATKVNHLINERQLDVPHQTKGMSLAELFNYNQEDYCIVKSSVGFN